MSKSKAIEHVVLRVSTQQGEPDTVFLCKHCEGQTMVTPTDHNGDQQHGEVSLFALQKRAAAFTLMHEDCEKPSRQLSFSDVPERLRDVPGLGSGFAECEVPAGSTMCGVSVADAIAVRQRLPNPRNEATCWLELWPQLEEALAPHEYLACVEHTAFAEAFPVDSRDWRALARWAACESSNWDGPRLVAPSALRQALANALEAARARHQAIADKARAAKMGQGGNTANARKPRSQKRPLVLHVHASNDTHPTKSAPNHLHRTVSTVEQADSLRGLEVQSVQLRGGVWDIPLLTYLKTQVLGPMNVPVSEGLVTAAATEPVTDGAL